MRKLSQIPMRIRTAVQAVEKELNRGSKGTIINTEFGMLGIEFHDVKGGMMIDPLHPVNIVPWSESPGTFWVKSNRKENLDYYVNIDIYNSSITDHLAVIEALSRVMMMRLGFNDPNEKIINAMVTCFTTNYDEVDETVDTLSDEYMFNYMGQFIRKRADVNLVVREMIMNKQELAKEVIKIGEMLCEQVSRDENSFYDLYSKQIWGIYLYALQEEQQSLSHKVKNLTEIAKLEMEDVTIKASLLAVNK